MLRTLRPLLLSLALIAILLALLFWNSAPRESSLAKRAIVLHCAAGLKPPVEAIAHRYEAEYGVAVHIQYGGSGALLSSIEVSHKGDLYLAADEEYARLAREKGLCAEVLEVARQHPVVAVPRGNPAGIRSLEDLLRPGVRVSFANEEAAVGKEAKRLLGQIGLWDRLVPNIKVFKPTVGDVANDVRLGAVDAGVVWDATARQHSELELVEVDAFRSAYSSMVLCVLQFSTQPTAALHFGRFLTARDRGLPVFAQKGYEPVDGDVWEERPRLILYSGGVNRMAIQETITAFEQREGVDVERVFNGCGILVAEMKALEGKPSFPDAYFACDVSFLSQVRDLFGPPLSLTRTRMVILVPKGNPQRIASLADLAKPGLRLGVAEARFSALGALLERLLESEGLLEKVMANVRAKTPTADLLVNQIRTGSLDAVVVYEANASQVRDVLDVIPLREDAAVATQPIATSVASAHKRLAARLIEALRSSASRERFRAAGFEWTASTPESP